MRASRWCRVTVWLAATAMLSCMLPASPAVLGQCPGGMCPAPGLRVREPIVSAPAANTPRPAWRYEEATGHRAAVVRIKTADRGGQHSVGSGVLIRWGKRVVVLTARHVVKDAARISVWLRSGRWYEGKVLKADATWDVAVVDIGPVTQAEPAELEFGDAAHPKDGDRLESCGYGPDGKLAVNYGRFLGYQTAPNGGSAADWMTLSGRARGGDSGGPIYNERGRVVGVLWGTDGEEVVGAQAGRLHVVLESSCGSLQAVARSEPNPALPAPVTPQAETPPQSTPDGVLASLTNDTCRLGRLLPLRPREPTPPPAPQVIVQSDPEARGALNRIDSKMDVVVRNTTPPPPTAAEDKARFNPLVAGLIIAGAVVIGFVIYFNTQKG